MATNNSTNTYITPTSGQILSPGQCVFNAYLSSTQADVTGDGTSYTVVCDTELMDQGANYNNGTGVFTAPVTGNYCFIASVCFADVGVAHTNFFLQFTLTGKAFQQGYFNLGAIQATGNFQHQITALTPMAAGDTASLLVNVNNGTKVVDVVGGTTVNTLTFFSGYLVG